MGSPDFEERVIALLASIETRLSYLDRRSQLRPRSFGTISTAWGTSTTSSPTSETTCWGKRNRELAGALGREHALVVVWLGHRLI
jgi:hypothetical protein